MRPNSPEARKIRDQLVARKKRLLARYRNEMARADEELDQRPVDTIDVASDRWDATVLDQVGESDASAVASIDAALTRLDHGTYGTCARCGGRIGKARLRVLPEAAQCSHCAVFAESRVPRFTHRA